MTIAKYAKTCGVPVSTIRNWVKLGEITPTAYTDSGYMPLLRYKRKNFFFTSFINIMNITSSTIYPIKQTNLSFNAVRNKRLIPQLLHDTVEIGGKCIENSKAKAAGISAVIASLLCAKNQGNKKTPTLEECMIARDSGNLDEYKKKLVPFLESMDCDEDYIDLIANSNNREDIDLWINNAVDMYLNIRLNNAIEELDIMERIENRDFDDELNKKNC